MFEFNTEKEAREVFDKVKGYKVLSEVIYYNDIENSALLLQTSIG